MKKQSKEPDSTVTREMLDVQVLLNPTALAHGMFDDMQAYQQDILSRANQLVTVRRDSRLGQAIVKSKPALYGNCNARPDDCITLSEKDVAAVIQGCIKSSTVDRLMATLLGEGEEGEK